MLQSAKGCEILLFIIIFLHILSTDNILHLKTFCVAFHRLVTYASRAENQTQKEAKVENICETKRFWCKVFRTW